MVTSMHCEGVMSETLKTPGGIAKRGGPLAHRGRPTLRQAAQFAALEAARTPYDLCASLPMCASPSIFRCTAYLDLLGALDRIGTTRSALCHVRRLGVGEFLETSPLGGRFVNSLVHLLVDGEWASGNVRIEPRLRMALGHGAEMLSADWYSAGFAALRKSNAQLSALLLSELALRVRSDLATKAQIERTRRHAARNTTFFQDVKAYFKALAAQHPDAIVLRYDLRQQELSLSVSAEQRAKLAHERMSAWLRAVRKTHGASVAGHVWAFQRDDLNRFRHHVLLVLDGPSEDARSELFASCSAAWTDLCGASAATVDCKGPLVDLRYRGRRTAVQGDSLASELLDAAIYFAFANHLVAPDFDDQPPERGFKAAPRVLRPWEILRV